MGHYRPAAHGRKQSLEEEEEEEEEDGPSPLRTADHFWGITDATPKQSRLLHIANLLLASLALIFAAHLKSGTSAWMERPHSCSLGT